MFERKYLPEIYEALDHPEKYIEGPPLRTPTVIVGTHVTPDMIGELLHKERLTIDQLRADLPRISVAAMYAALFLYARRIYRKAQLDWAMDPLEADNIHRFTSFMPAHSRNAHIAALIMYAGILKTEMKDDLDGHGDKGTAKAASTK